MKIRIPSPKHLLLPALIAAVACAQTNAQTNLLGNPGFERSIRTPNAWQGLSDAGNLLNPSSEAPVLAQAGGIGPTTMPPGISAGDYNADGLADIAAADGNGFIKIYFNQGSRTEPKFGAAEVTGLFFNPLPITRPANRLATEIHRRLGTQRIHIADVTRSGRLDILAGTYGGQLFLFPNGGGNAKPDYRTPPRLDTAEIKTGSRVWANILAPFAVDWNKDSRTDILVGEGSYSANSIHILLGKGSGKPVFEDSDRHVLAYGMGLEQLTPCAVDYNGDGRLDLLVSERGGRVAVYLSGTEPWKPGDTLGFHSFITIDGAPPAGLPPATAGAGKPDPLDALKATNLLSAGGSCTLSSADFNGDGLFDLVFAKRSGRIAMSINKGTATEPKFPAPTDLKADVPGVPFLSPSGWTVDAGADRGNFYGFSTVLKSGNQTAPGAVQPAEGTSFLQSGYFAEAGNVMPRPVPQRPATKDSEELILTPNVFELSQTIAAPLKVGKTYTLSFKSRGTQVSNASATLQYRGVKRLGDDIIVKGDRGAVKKQLNQAEETKRDTAPFSAGTNWNEFKREFTIEFEKKELSGLEATAGAELRLAWTLAPGTGQLALDDFKLVEKP